MGVRIWTKHEILHISCHHRFLRAADALPLAAAMVLAGDDISELTMLTFDERLQQSAQREGINVIGF